MLFISVINQLNNRLLKFNNHTRLYRCFSITKLKTSKNDKTFVIPFKKFYSHSCMLNTFYSSHTFLVANMNETFALSSPDIVLGEIPATR